MEETPTVRDEMVLRALRASPVSVFYQDADLVYRWVENPRFSWLESDVVGRTDADIMSPEFASRATRVKRKALASGERQQFTFAIDGSDERVWFQIFIQPDVAPNGSVKGIVCSAFDITEVMRKEMVLKTLLREVSHRSKNMLAMVLSIAMQTGRTSATIPQFINGFVGRIQSMAKSQDLITDSNWRGATMEELVAKQVMVVSDAFGDRVHYSGDRINLLPNVALHIGLALHELSTNAVSFGALSRPSGRVDITARRIAGEGAPRIELDWRETGGPEVTPQPRRSFGSVTLERIVPAAVNGCGRLSFEGEGLHYRLDLADTMGQPGGQPGGQPEQPVRQGDRFGAGDGSDSALAIPADGELPPTKG